MSVRPLPLSLAQRQCLGRPLPDERPRQSVANLIGRFETQSKQLSVSQGSASRSSSVVSHITGDSAKEEVKEKRDWLPKSVVDRAAATAAHSRLLPLTINSESAAAKKETSDESDVPLTAKALNASHPQVQEELNTYLENWRKDLPKPVEMEPESVTPRPVSPANPPAPAPAQKVPVPKTPRTPATKTPAIKLPTSASSKSSIASAKSTETLQKTVTSKQSLTPPTAQPLKPQQTGQSVVSTTSVARRTTSKAPTTPKTPARTESGTKTPTPSRSSGLFAPTAASLARARNTPPMPPLPVKKTTLSSDAMERLSKPTAASLSKAKSMAPAPAAPSPKSSPRMTVAKSKPTTATSTTKVPLKGKKEPAVPSAASEDVIAATASSVALATAASELVQEPEQATTVDGNGHINEPAVEAEDPAPAPAESNAEPKEVECGETADPDVPHVDIPASPTPPQDDAEVHPEITNGIEAAATKDVGTDLEDIVNLLEGIPVARPTTDEILEIPDEEDK